MNDLGDVRDLFDPPCARRPKTFWKNAAFVVAVILATISGYIAIAGLITFLFVGQPLGIAVSLLWLIPTGGFAYLARLMAR
jgi:hypothetical protein